MPVRIGAAAEAERRGREELQRVARELRVARLRQGISQRAVARRLGKSISWVSRSERGRGATSSVDLIRHAAAVGLRVRVGVFPLGRVPLDRPQLGLLRALERRVGRAWHRRLEVPVPIAGDLRAADAVLSSSTGSIVVEAETRLVDLQATLRAVHLKQRDLGADRVLLLVAATAANRRVLSEVGLPVRTRAVLAALRSGQLPDPDAVIVLPIETDGAQTAPLPALSQRGHRDR